MVCCRLKINEPALESNWSFHCDRHLYEMAKECSKNYVLRYGRALGDYRLPLRTISEDIPDVFVVDLHTGKYWREFCHDMFTPVGPVKKGPPPWRCEKNQ